MRLHLSLRIKVKVFVLRPHAPIGLFRAAIGIVAIHLVQRETIGYVPAPFLLPKFPLGRYTGEAKMTTWY
jgi:hypothetical protein